MPDSVLLARSLPGRRADAIERRAGYLTKSGITNLTAQQRRTRWTAEEDEKAVLDYSRGLPLVKIAEVLSRTYAGVETRLRNLRKKQIMTFAGQEPEGKT